MRVKHWHNLMAAVAIIHRPDGTFSDGRYLCVGCGAVLDYIAGRWHRSAP